MRTFGYFVIAIILYVFVAIAVFTMAENLDSSGDISYAAFCWTISLLGAVLFGLVASGALLVRKAGIWPSAMLSTVCLSVLDAVAILWPVAVPSSGPTRWYPLLVEQFGRSSHVDLLFGGFWLSATGAVALLWAGLLSVPRFTMWRDRIRKFTVACVFSLATGLGAVILLLFTEIAGRWSEFDFGFVILIAQSGIVMVALSIIGTLLVAAFSLSQWYGRLQQNRRKNGADAPPKSSWQSSSVEARSEENESHEAVGGASMRAPLRLGAVLLLFLIAGGSIYGIATGFGAGLSYEGKSPGRWIELLGQSYVPNEIFGRSDRSKPTKALQAIGPAAVPIASNMLTDRRWRARKGAVEALAFWGMSSSPAALDLAQAIGNEKRGIMYEAIDALANMGPAAGPALDILEKSLANSDLEVRVDMAYAILRIAPEHESAMKALIDSLSYEDPGIQGYGGGVRKSAALRLGLLGPAAKTAVPALTELLNGEQEPELGLGYHGCGVSHAAVQALAQIGPGAEAAIPALLVAADEDSNRHDPQLREFAALALGKIAPGEQSVPALVRCLKSSRDPNVYLPVIDALKNSGPTVIDPLIDLLKNPDIRVRTNACKALESIGPPAKAAVPALIKLLKNSEELGRDWYGPALKDSATRALAAIDPASFKGNSSSGPRSG